MALSDVITTLSTYCLAVINNSVSGDERIFSLSNFDGFCLLLYLLCRNGFESNATLYICKHRAWSTDRSSAGCTSTNSRCIVGFLQPLFDKVADEPLRAAVVVCSGAVRDNSKCVFRCSGVCTCISVFFRLRGLLLLIIDYLALLRALLSVLFSRVSVCASESTHQRTNAMAGDSVLRNISLEHLRRGHAPTGGEEIVLDKRTRTVGRTSHLFSPC